MEFYDNMIINWRTALSQVSAFSSTQNMITGLGDNYHNPR